MAARGGSGDEALRHAHALREFAAPRGMRGFHARALWVQALAEPPKQAALLREAITLARSSEERPLMRALLHLAGSPEARAVTEEIAASLPEADLRARFTATSPL